MDKKGHCLKVAKIMSVIVGFTIVLTACGKHVVFSPAAHTTLEKNGVVFLGQGWSNEERQQLSHTSFGSRIVEYDWFLALEHPDSELLFRSNAHMTQLGFIPDSESKLNPDSLPIGFAKDVDANDLAWVGLTCAACHTGSITVNEKNLRIDGGQGLINYSQFEQELLAALKATVNQPEKWQRFIARINVKKSSPEDIKKSIQVRIKQLETRYVINATRAPYGHGRLDAFGQIFNAIAVESLQIPENKREPNAPTSFPVLWDASHLDVVQWNASAPNSEPGPLAQNATTALAVYGTVDVLGYGKTYPSSIQIKNLGYIQREFYKLSSPQWPESIAGALNKTLMVQGEKIYQQQCLKCHSIVDSKNPTRQLVAVAVPAKEVGTDEQMVKNFTEGTVKTGELEGKHFALWFGKKFGAESARLDVVMHVVAGALIRHPIDSIGAIVKEYAKNKTSNLDSAVNYYKARPINGIWSSAPYLHNGSVPTVYDLLLPVAQRPVDFFVGNRALDIVKVGNKTDATENASLFDTHLVGNSNQGHEYGTELSENDRLALLEFIKSL